MAPALTALHRDPERPWTLVDLAAEAGTSRSVLAGKFRHYRNGISASLANRRLAIVGFDRLRLQPHRPLYGNLWFCANVN